MAAVTRRDVKVGAAASGPYGSGDRRDVDSTRPAMASDYRTRRARPRRPRPTPPRTRRQSRAVRLFFPRDTFAVTDPCSSFETGYGYGTTGVGNGLKARVRNVVLQKFLT